MLNIVGTGFEFAEPSRHLLAQPRQIGNRHVVFACRRTQGEEPLFYPLELTRVGLEIARMLSGRNITAEARAAAASLIAGGRA